MKLQRIIIFIVLLIVLAGMLFPVYWMVKTSFSTEAGLVIQPKDLIPSNLTVRNYLDLWQWGPFPRYFLNSLLVAGLVTLGNMVFCLMVGYAFARREFFFKNLLFLSVIFVIMIPAHIIIVPLFLIIKWLGWYDTYLALIVPWMVTPLGIFLMRQYIQSLPRDLEDAARIDGAGDFKILFSIVMPLCRPALAVLSIGALATVCAGPCSVALMMTGNQQTAMAINGGCVVGAILAGLWAVRRYGMAGVAVVFGVELILLAGLKLFFARKKTGVWTHFTFSPVLLYGALSKIVHMFKPSER